MVIAETEKKYTEADYMLLEEGAPFQLINYDLVMSPSPVPLHQLLLIKLTRLISGYLESQKNTGVLLIAPMDVRFDEGNILQPDILFISAERKNDIIKQRIEGAPDLVIEILSPSTGYYDLTQKKSIYEQYGVKEYVIIDPMRFQAEMFVLKDAKYHLHGSAEKAGALRSVLLPGLILYLEELFNI